MLVDDHTLVRRGLRLIVEDEADMRVVGEAEDGEGAVKMARRLRPTVVVMDWSLPGMDGLAAASQIARSCPETAVLMLSMHSDHVRMRKAASAGVRGYLVKNVTDFELVAAIQRVAAGDLAFDPHVFESKAITSAKLTMLTARELQVLQMIVNGKTNREIAIQLHLSPYTIAAHRANIMHALRINKTAKLVVYAIRNGFVSVP